MVDAAARRGHSKPPEMVPHGHRARPPTWAAPGLLDTTSVRRSKFPRSLSRRAGDAPPSRPGDRALLTKAPAPR
ncbi:hypothetical protein DB32_003982 [Sandaracinus amylolyticus]|uniref:Uncharacterized protein n=1 Tax=Sandaracinus amylolyticus TaxID=927083 RepID=A0A0F6W462_9BACT|nr:hypothetical protein DB32_003982 [Sandaracinus amylolyticus]